MAKSYCYLTRKKGGLFLDFSYDPDFIAILKDRVPPKSREYDPSTRQWWIHGDYERQIRIDVKSSFANVIEA